MIIRLTLKEGGDWWQVEVPNTDSIKSILNTGYWLEQNIYSMMLRYDNSYMIYDFALRQWR